MRVREIKREDIKVGVKVIHKSDYNRGNSDTKIIRRIFKDRVFYESNEWDYIGSVTESYFLVEELKTNDTEVMTYTGISTHGLTHNKNYNVKDTGAGYYELYGDDGKKRLKLKEFFEDPSERSNGKTLYNFFDSYRYVMSEKLREDLRSAGYCHCVTKEGTKHDQDKLKPSLLFNDFPHAIEEVIKVLKFGADKYSEGNWLKVENGVERYRNAAHRHMLAQEEFDDESGLLHLAHEATSVLMMLELKLREMEDAE